MEQKSLITIILVLLSLFLVYYFFSLEPAISIKDIFKDEVTPGQFVSALAVSNKVYIVQDLTNSNESVRKNIQQCGIDLAGSSGLAAKDKKTFAFEGGLCYGFDNSSGVSINKCLIELKNNQANASVFYIRQGSKTTFYTQGTIISLDKNYSRGDCNVNFVNKPQPVSTSDVLPSDVLREIASQVVPLQNNTNANKNASTNDTS